MLNPRVYLKFCHSLYQKRLRKTVYSLKTSRPICDRDWDRECASKPDAFPLSSCLLLRNSAKINGQTEHERTTHVMQFAHTNYKINNIHSCGENIRLCAMSDFFFFNFYGLKRHARQESNIMRWISYILQRSGCIICIFVPLTLYQPSQYQCKQRESLKC